jgi:DNA-binding XRE family transcriptional regulator
MARDATHLYFIGAEGLDFIKVGRSKNPASRLRHLRAASPYKLRLLATYEGLGHLEPYILASLRATASTNGEWFLAGTVVLETLVHDAAEHYAEKRCNVEHHGADPRMGLGSGIRRARIDKGWQQQDLQEATKISQTYLSKIEHNKVDPSISIVQKIARALGVSIDRLVQEDPDSASEPTVVASVGA